ncbi:MAG: hypothetical protein H0T42_10995 [Deltaproteobacteria bacterium]|nr:hypothetical protein [Deltaproteobacteria bacterium]
MSTGSDLVPPGKGLRIAESARTVRPGELLVIDSHGREVSRRTRSLNHMKLGVIGGLVLGGPLALLGITGLSAGLLAGGVIAATLVAVRRTTYPYVEAQSRLSAGDLLGAEAILAKLRTPSRGPRAQLRAWSEGFIAYARGEDEKAIRIFERALTLFRPQNIHRVVIQIALVELHARRGDVAQAKSVRGGISPPEPVSELVEVSLAGADLAIAIVNHSELQLDEERIDRWIRLALEINNTSLTLAALARVIAVRGDNDLADHLAREARDRFCWCPLECWPDLARWIDERNRASATVSSEHE